MVTIIGAVIPPGFIARLIPPLAIIILVAFTTSFSGELGSFITHCTDLKTSDLRSLNIKHQPWLTLTPGLLTYVQCSHVQDTRGALSLLDDTDTNSSSDALKKSSLSSVLPSDLSRSLCFLEFREAFLDLEFEPEFVLDLSLVFLFLDLLVEVFDLFDFLDLVEFLDL